MAAYTFPVIGGRVTSEYGIRTAPMSGASVDHRGIDIAVPVGTSVMSAMSGVVKAAAYNSAYGNYVVVNHGNGLETVYKHLSKVLVPKGGTQVSEGQIIALSGNSGSATTGPHLHFEIVKDGKAVNPMSFSVSDRALSAAGIDTDSLVNLIKSNWWLIGLSLVVVSIIRK